MRYFIKAKRMAIGTISRGRKKVAEGKWVPVKGDKATSKEKKPERKMVVGDKPGKAGYSIKSPEKFASVRDKMTPKKYEAYVTKYSADEYKEKGAKTYVSDSGKSGYAIASDGDLISVFSTPGAHEGHALVDNAIANGATKLDCLGPSLPEFYEKHGFVVTETMKWDDQYAPQDWNYEEHKRPSVYMMELKKDKLTKAEQEAEEPDEDENEEGASESFIELGKQFIKEVLE